ncbi:MAG: trigger factor [Anaerolineae bacterium]|jgi:trigger factor
MKVTTERLDNCQVNVVIEVDADEIHKKLRRTGRRISRQFEIPGYRRGRAPLRAVVRTFGREAVRQEALDDFGNDLYEKALEQIDYEPFQPGELQEVEWDPFRMTILLPIQPEIDLGDYRAVRVPLDPEPVTDEDIEEQLAELRQQHVQWIPVERPAAWGDQVVVDVEGTVDGEEIIDEGEEEVLLDEEATFYLPGLSEQIVGMSSGEKETFVLTVPDDAYDKDLVGREATVTVELHTVREKDMPPLDDDLAMMVGDYDSLDDLRAALREQMETSALEAAEAEHFERVVGAVIEGAAKFEYPSQAVDQESEFLFGQIQQEILPPGMDMDAFLGMMGKTREEYKQELRPAAEERLRARLVLEQITRREGLEVGEDEIEAEIAQMLEEAGDKADQMRAMLDSEVGRQMLVDDLLRAGARERLLQIAKGNAPPLEEQAEAEAEVEAETKADVEVEIADDADVQEELGEEPESDASD